MTWSPDSDAAGGWTPDEPDDPDARPEAVLVTNVAFRLRLEPLPHARAKPGEQAFATYLADVVVAGEDETDEVAEDDDRSAAEASPPTATERMDGGAQRDDAGATDDDEADDAADAPEADPDEERRPVAVGMLPTDDAARLLASDLFAEPAPLMLRAADTAEGNVRAVLSALLPQSTLERFARAGAVESEPWLASVPTEPEGLELGGAADDEEGEEEALLPFALGVLLRLSENRKHPGDLASEAADLFISVLRGGAMDADAKKIENLLSGL